jgi:heat shock protein HslJ
MFSMSSCRGFAYRLLALSIAMSPAVMAQAPPSAAPAPVFALPATFAGVLPCADCAGIAHTLTLRADGLYRMRRTYLGRPGEPVAEVGRWSADQGGARLALGRGPAPQWLAVIDGQTLRQLDRQGRPFTSGANIELRRTAQVDAITEPLRWRGEFSYLADAASFTDCASGLRWPVAAAGDYLALERQYARDRSAPGEPLVVHFDGRLAVLPAMEGPPREHIVVDRAGATEPGASCASAPGVREVAAASLKDTYWKLVELNGRPVPPPAPQQREVRITLASGGTRAFGFSGCNQLAGVYEQAGDALRFTNIAGTLRACVAPLMELEAEVHQMLRATTRYRIDGQRLTLLAGEQVLARLDAVYLR